MRKNILIIRRDNIGDLICTTPLISTLRKSFPEASINVFVNSYNAPIISENKEIDNIFVYKKAKHKAHDESTLKIYIERLATYLKLRMKGVDIAILAGGADNKRSLKVAKMVGAKQIIGYTYDESESSGITTPISIDKTQGMHEVELTHFLATPLGINVPPPACTLTPSSFHLNEAKEFLTINNISSDNPVIGLHISARKPSNRWTENNYVTLIHQIWEQYQYPIVLFWSPGSKDNPLHPGDDELAKSIQQQCTNVHLTPFPTKTLEQLIAGLSLCNPVVCSDGGAMHIAAATGCSVVCFFGDSDAKRWFPWGTKHSLIQKDSLNVSDISVDETLLALETLLK